NRWIGRHIPRAGLAAAVTTAVVVLLIVVPGGWVAYRFATQAADAAEQVQQSAAEGNSVRGQAERVPGLGPVVGWAERAGINVETQIHGLIEENTRDLTALARGSITAIVQFLVAVFILYYLLRDHASF